MTTIQEVYRRLHPRSARLHQEAVKTFPSGVTHDIRHLTPFPLYVDHALGSCNKQETAYEIVDYVMGHGALFLGRVFPASMKSFRADTLPAAQLAYLHLAPEPLQRVPQRRRRREEN